MANRKDCAAVILYTAERATRMALDAIQVRQCKDVPFILISFPLNSLIA